MFQDKVIVITGGANGIGKCIAEEFKKQGAHVCVIDCAEILSLIEQGKIDTTPLITHRYKLEDIEEAYHLFENKMDRVIKVAVEP